MKTPLLFSLLSLAFSVGISAAVVVEYPFPSNTSSGAPVVYDSNLSASNPAWVGVSPTYGFGGSFGNAYISSTNKIPAFDAGKYLTFTVEAEEGFTLRLDAFHFELGGTSPTLPLTVYAELRTSVDNFASSLPLEGGGPIASHVVVPGSSPIYTPFSIALGDDFEALGPVTFPLHIYLTTTATNAWLRLDSFTLEGATQAVPEPSAAWLLFAAAGGGFLIARHRLQRRGSSFYGN